MEEVRCVNVKSIDILFMLTKTILGAINFDNIPKWEIEDEILPKTYFGDRARNNPSKPFNREAISRMIKIYRSQLGLFTMKVPIEAATSCTYANKLIDYFQDITSIDMSRLKNHSSQKIKNIEKREVIMEILLIILNSIEDEEYFDKSKVRSDIQACIDAFANKNLYAIRVAPDSYLPIPTSEQKLYLVEAKGRCPKCSRKIIRATDNSVLEAYNFIKLNPVGDDSPNNKMVLCRNCYEEFIADKTGEIAKKLQVIKRNMLIDNMYADTIDEITIEQEIEQVLDSLTSIKSAKDLQLLNYAPVKVEKKIPEDFLLCDKVKGYVVRYFNHVADKLKQLNSENKLKYVLIGSEIKTVYLAFEQLNYSQSEIFDLMTNWLMGKTGCNKKEACEIVIAYYIQNCEVFNEVAE